MDATASLTPDRVLRRLEWHVIRRLDGRLQGDYRTALRGHGTDYLDLRDYEYGDDVRHIDWNVSARMDSVFVREFTEDRELTGWLLIDRSASMTFGPIDRTKELVGLEVATTFAQLLVRGGNRVARHPVRQRRPADHPAPPGSQPGARPAPGAAASGLGPLGAATARSRT